MTLSRAHRFLQTVTLAATLLGTGGRGLLAALVGETSSGLSLSVTPRVAIDQASSQALGYVAKAEGVAVTELVASAPVLSIYDPHLLTPDNFDPSLVWRFEVMSVATQPIRYFVLVDAATLGFLFPRVAP